MHEKELEPFTIYYSQFKFFSLMYGSSIAKGTLCNRTNDQNYQSVLVRGVSFEAHMVMFRLVFDYTVWSPQSPISLLHVWICLCMFACVTAGL